MSRFAWKGCVFTINPYDPAGLEPVVKQVERIRAGRPVQGGQAGFLIGNS